MTSACSALTWSLTTTAAGAPSPVAVAPLTLKTTNRTEATDMAEETEPESLEALQLRAGTLSLVIKELTEALKPMRAEIEARMPRRSRVEPELPGTSVHVATMARKRDAHSIAGWDSKETVAWVDKKYPGEVELVEQIREAFRKRFLVTDDGQIVGPKGEMDIPGLFVATQEGAFAITPNRDAAGQVFAALRGVTLLELVAGPSHE